MLPNKQTRLEENQEASTVDVDSLPDEIIIESLVGKRVESALTEFKVVRRANATVFY